MIMQVLPCPYCQGTDIVRHGTTSEGKQHYQQLQRNLSRKDVVLIRGSVGYVP
jgi:transposase-like protein